MDNVDIQQIHAILMAPGEDWPIHDADCLTVRLLKNYIQANKMMAAASPVEHMRELFTVMAQKQQRVSLVAAALQGMLSRSEFLATVDATSADAVKYADACIKKMERA